MAPARPSLNVPRARRALRTGLAGAVVLLAVAAAARLVWPSGLHLAFIPDDAGNALGTAEATGGDFPEDVTVPSILPILGLRALSSLVRRTMDLDAGEDWATGGHRADAALRRTGSGLAHRVRELLVAEVELVEQSGKNSHGASVTHCTCMHMRA